jgi:hypothetical protein
MSSTSLLSRVRILPFVACVLSGLIMTGVAGCESNPLSGAKLHQVKGKVLLPDGKPLTGGQVTFVGAKSGVTNSAPIDSSGNFAFKEGAGALPEGDYKVRIDPGESTKMVLKGGRGGVPQGKLAFDSVFLDEDASGLTATVSSDEAKNNFEFKLVPTAASATGKKSDFGRGDDARR